MSIESIRARLAAYATTNYRQWLDTSFADISALLDLLSLANGEIDALRLWRESASKKLGRAYIRYQRVARAFKVANRERHHAQSRADDLATQRNSWMSGFQDMQIKRNTAEQERDEAKLALNYLSSGISQMFPHAAYSPDDPAQNLEIIRNELSRLYAQIEASEATMKIRTDK